MKTQTKYCCIYKNTNDDKGEKKQNRHNVRTQKNKVKKEEEEGEIN